MAKLDLLKLELRESKTSQEAKVDIAVVAVEDASLDAIADQVEKKNKKPRRNLRKAKGPTASKETIVEPTPLMETTNALVINNDRNGTAAGPDQDMTKKKRRTRHRTRGSKKETASDLVPGSRKAGEQASQKDLGILIITTRLS